MTDAEIIAIRDEHLPSQGQPFDALAFGRAVAAKERERCLRIVKVNQYRNGHHLHDGTTMGHYDVSMVAEIESGLPPKA